MSKSPSTPEAFSGEAETGSPQKMRSKASTLAPDSLLRRLEWTVLRRLDGVLHGDYRTLFRGFGLDLAGLREYQHSDDVRHIDWNVTARLQSPYVRQFNEDREITALLVVCGLDHSLYSLSLCVCGCVWVCVCVCVCVGTSVRV